MQHLETIRKHIFSIKNRMILLGIGLGALFWIIDSAVAVYTFNEGELVTQMLVPSPHQIWRRVLVLTFIIGFAFHANYLSNKRKRATDALRASEEKYRQLVELSPDAIVIQCEDRIVFMNLAGVKLFGIKEPEQLVGKSVWDFVLPQNREIVKARYRQVQEKGEKVPMVEQRFIRLDGTQINVEVTAIPCAYEGKPSVQAIFRDVTEHKRTESELIKLRKAVEASGEVIFLTDREGIITFINPEFTRFYGYEAAEVVGKTTPRILKSGMMTLRDYKLFWKRILNKQIVKGEWRNKCKDGTLVAIEGSTNPILDEHENIIGFLAIQRDIAERKQAEQEIRKRNEELAALNAIAATASQSLDLVQLLHNALDEVLQLDMFGGMAKGMLFSLDEQNDTLSLVAHRGTPEDHPCLVNPPQLGECLCGLAVQQGQVIIANDCWGDKQHSRRWPSMNDHKDICLPLKARGRVLGAMNLRLPEDQEIIGSDVKLLTSVADQIGVALENARLFEAVSRQHERLRLLSARLTEVEEAERRRLARELHDQAGQNLTGLGINLNIIRTLMPEDVTDEVHSRLDESQALVKQITKHIRGVMTDLRPPMLDDYGLMATLRWYGNRFASRTGISVTVQGEELLPHLPPPVENALFRIAQEALTNVAKHAQATEVTITMSIEGERVCLVIADNGIGFDPSYQTKPVGDQGWGLLIMAERAEVVGARCWIESHPIYEGTRVIAEATQ